MKKGFWVFWLGALGLVLQNLFFMCVDGGDGGGSSGDGGSGAGNDPTPPQQTQQNQQTPPPANDGDLRAQLDAMRKENEEFRKRFTEMDNQAAYEAQLQVAENTLNNYEKHFPDFKWRDTIERMKQESNEEVKKKYLGPHGVFSYWCDFMKGKENLIPPNGNITKSDEIKSIEEKLAKRMRLSADEEVAYANYKINGGI